MEEIKRLYVSDLDGTLLDSNAEISYFTANALNSLIERGMNFTFATARSVYSAKKIISAVNINVPCVLMNGVSIYDLKNDKYIKNEFIPMDSSAKIIRAFEEYDVHCFLYKMIGGVLTSCYSEINSYVMRSFAEVRKNKYNKPFIQSDSLYDTADENTVYFTTMGEYEALLPVGKEISLISGIDHTFYQDTYTKQWYLEIFSEKASKANAVKFLRNEYGFDEVICFGDNLNDLTMFSESDVKIAVGNAKEDLKKQADFIIDTNDNDGAAKWLIENYKR